MNSRDYLLELRDSTGMTRREFCEYFEIPYRTLQDWELGNRKMPDYLLRLMEYKVRMEQLVKNKEDRDRVGEIQDKEIELSVPVEQETVWLNRRQVSELFDRDVKTIGKHINNALKE